MEAFNELNLIFISLDNTFERHFNRYIRLFSDTRLERVSWALAGVHTCGESKRGPGCGVRGSVVAVREVGALERVDSGGEDGVGAQDGAVCGAVGVVGAGLAADTGRKLERKRQQ